MKKNTRDFLRVSLRPLRFVFPHPDSTGLQPALLPLHPATRLNPSVGLRFEKMLFEMRGRF
jgi:hypothetical protein